MATDMILVQRLAEMYNPFEVLGISPDAVAGAQEVVNHATYDLRDTAYDLGRVAFFVRELQEGKKLDPLMLDNACDGGQIFPEPIVQDGNHRLAAAILAKQEKVEVNYGGLTFLLNYLKGKTKKLPTYRGY